MELLYPSKSTHPVRSIAQYESKGCRDSSAFWSRSGPDIVLQLRQPLRQLNKLQDPKRELSPTPLRHRDSMKLKGDDARQPYQPQASQR
jgi:hypothetical protein